MHGRRVSGGDSNVSGATADNAALFLVALYFLCLFCDVLPTAKYRPPALISPDFFLFFSTLS
ncbi:MAG: hypothetical protein ACSLEN_14620 [Candidatus Malihini olakiniferum]